MGLSVERKSNLRVMAIFTMFFIMLIAYFDRANVSILFADKVFTDALGITGNRAVQGSLMSLFLLAYGLSSFFIGLLVDRIEIRKLLTGAVVIWAILMFLHGSVTLLTIYFALRILLGVAESVVTPTSSRIVQHWFPLQERGKANSAWIWGTQIAPAISMPFVAWIDSKVGWQGTFMSLALLSLIPIIFIALYIYDYPNQHPKISKSELDYIASGQKTKDTEAEEKRKDTSWVKNYRYWLVIIGYTSTVSVLWGTISWLPSYLKTSLGFSWSAMGWLSGLPYMLGAIVMMTVGAIADKINLRAPLYIMGMLTSAVLLYVGISIQNSIAIALLIAFSIAFSQATYPISYTMLQNNVPAYSVGTATGIFNGVAYSWCSVTPYIIGWLCNVTGSFTGGFIYLIIVMVIGAVATIPLIKERY